MPWTGLGQDWDVSMSGGKQKSPSGLFCYPIRQVLSKAKKRRSGGIQLRVYGTCDDLPFQYTHPQHLKHHSQLLQQLQQSLSSVTKPTITIQQSTVKLATRINNALFNTNSACLPYTGNRPRQKLLP
ncbi:hypothetical protein VTL71DRAFT_16314 [Oculimacula yallundae]|uniref:Uncharacterized protein n=1 Tax=Oculimacula yallundae TaxID=86028 RepID=A0ABR4CE32_9HELO